MLTSIQITCNDNNKSSNKSTSVAVFREYYKTKHVNFNANNM